MKMASESNWDSEFVVSPMTQTLNGINVFFYCYFV